MSNRDAVYKKIIEEAVHKTNVDIFEQTNSTPKITEYYNNLAGLCGRFICGKIKYEHGTDIPKQISQRKYFGFMRRRSTE